MTDGTEKDRKPAKSREEALQDMFTPEIRSAMADVNRDLDRYRVERSDEAYTKLAVSILSAASRGAVMSTPVTGLSKDGKGMELGTYESSVGKGYVLCTSPEEIAACPEPMIVFVNSGAVVQRAINDTEYKGIFINPYGKSPILLRREHMIMILQLMEKSRQSGK